MFIMFFSYVNVIIDYTKLFVRLGQFSPKMSKKSPTVFQPNADLLLMLGFVAVAITGLVSDFCGKHRSNKTT